MTLPDVSTQPQPTLPGTGDNAGVPAGHAGGTQALQIHAALDQIEALNPREEPATAPATGTVITAKKQPAGVPAASEIAPDSAAPNSAASDSAAPNSAAVSPVHAEPVAVTSMAQLLGETPAPARNKSRGPQTGGQPGPRPQGSAQGGQGPRGVSPLTRPIDTPFSAQGRICVTANMSQPGEEALSVPTGAQRLIGISISDGENTMFTGVPASNSRSGSIDDAFLRAVSLAPAMRQLELVTPHEQLWTRATWRDDIRELVKRKALDIRPRKPQSLNGHPGELAALLASRGQSGPRLLNYHLYSSAFADAEGQVFVGALLYGQGTLRMYSVKVEGADAARLDIAELQAALWAFSHVEDHSMMQLVQASAGLKPLWEGPSAGTMDDALRRAARPLRHDIEKRSVHFRQGTEPPVGLLVRASRELAGRLAITGKHPVGLLGSSAGRTVQTQTAAARQAGNA